MTVIHRFNDVQFLQHLSKEAISLTTTERQWLRYVLQQEETAHFISEDVKMLLLAELAEYADLAEIVTVKGRAQLDTSHAMITQLVRNSIIEKRSIRMRYRLRSGDELEKIVTPLQLQYVATSESWYVCWSEAEQHNVQKTPLSLIIHIEPLHCEEQLFDELAELLEGTQQRTEQLTLKLTPIAKELDEHRFLQAFTSYSPTIERVADDVYIHVCYAQQEKAVLLSKVRSFGWHVIVVSPQAVRDEMRTTIAKCNERYK